MRLLKNKNFSETITTGQKIFQSRKNIIEEENFEFSLGDEGGFGIKTESNQKPLEILTRAIERAGYQPGKEVALAHAEAETGC